MVQVREVLRRWLRDEGERLSRTRAAAKDQGLSLRSYRYNEAAKDTQTRRVGTGFSLRDDIEALQVSSEEWVDPRKVFESQLLTGGPVWLNKVALLSGFSWEVDDSGGDISMLYYEQAVSQAEPTLAETGEHRQRHLRLAALSSLLLGLGASAVARLYRPYGRRAPAGARDLIGPKNIGGEGSRVRDGDVRDPICRVGNEYWLRYPGSACDIGSQTNW